MNKEIRIKGMSCMHCVRHVTEALKDLDGVTDVNVDLKGEKATISINREIDDKSIIDSIDEAGYKVTGISSL
jgi:copper chaperone